MSAEKFANFEPPGEIFLRFSGRFVTPAVLGASVAAVALGGGTERGDGEEGGGGGDKIGQPLNFISFFFFFFHLRFLPPFPSGPLPPEATPRSGLVPRRRKEKDLMFDLGVGDVEVTNG